MEKFDVRTNRHSEIIDITRKIEEEVAKSGILNGVVYIYTPHTTCGIIINENADPDVKTDIIYKLDSIIDWNDPKYQHMEGNSAAHLKAIYCGNQKFVILNNGKLVLGTWEGIFLAEFDGVRNRTVCIKIIEG